MFCSWCCYFCFVFNSICLFVVVVVVVVVVLFCFVLWGAGGAGCFFVSPRERENTNSKKRILEGLQPRLI